MERVNSTFAPAKYGGIVVRSVVVCEESDSALEWVCQQENISVEVVGSGEDASITTSNHSLQRSRYPGQ